MNTQLRPSWNTLFFVADITEHGRPVPPKVAPTENIGRGLWQVTSRCPVSEVFKPIAQLLDCGLYHMICIDDVPSLHTFHLHFPSLSLYLRLHLLRRLHWFRLDSFEASLLNNVVFFQ